MAARTLADRVRDHFREQNAWLEQALADLNRLESGLEDPDLDALASVQAAHAAATQRFQEQSQALADAWRKDANITASDCAEVRALAKRAEALAEQLSEAYDRAAQRMRERAGKVKEALDGASRGRDLLRKFYQRPVMDSWFIDRKA